MRGVLRSRASACRPRDEEFARSAQAVALRLRPKNVDSRNHRHRQGRPARHRQEHRRLDARRRRLRSHRSRHRRLAGELRGRCRATQAAGRLHVGAAHRHHAGHEANHRRARDRGPPTQVKVLVGGAPVTLQYAREIGADGYCENANSAVSLVRDLVAGGAS